MGSKSSKPEVQPADVETGQLGTNVEVTTGTEAVAPPIYTLPQPQGTEYVTYSQAPPPYTLAQPQGAENVRYSQQNHQVQNEDGCCDDWKWWHWLLIVLALPFIIAISLILVVIFIGCLYFGVDISKCMTS